MTITNVNNKLEYLLNEYHKVLNSLKFNQIFTNFNYLNVHSRRSFMYKNI